MGKFLCKLGIHKWKYWFGLMYLGKTCERCEKNKLVKSMVSEEESTAWGKRLFKFIEEKK